MPKGHWEGRNWTEEDVFLVQELLGQGMQLSGIAARLGRSPEAVKIWMGRHGGGLGVHRPLSARAVAEKLGLPCAKKVSAWVRRGALKGRFAGRAGPNTRLNVTEDALLAFIEDRRYWHEWDPDRIPDRDLREWALEVRGGERYLLMSEVAQRYAVTPASVWDWIDLGLLPDVRLGGRGNHVVPESALATFVPPCERPRVVRGKRGFDAAEDEQLLRMRAEGSSWSEIGSALNRRTSSVQNRWQRLQTPRRPLGFTPEQIAALPVMKSRRVQEGNAVA